MPVYLLDGLPLLVDGQVAVSENCCCDGGGEPCPGCINCCQDFVMPDELELSLTFSGPGSDCVFLDQFPSLTLTKVPAAPNAYRYEASGLPIGLFCNRTILEFSFGCAGGTIVFDANDGADRLIGDVVVLSCDPFHAFFEGSSTNDDFSGAWNCEGTDPTCTTSDLLMRIEITE